MSDVLAAIYARVSSEQQADEHTIDSQVAALRTRVTEDALQLSAERQFLDEGYSGATLVRPALERLRDLVAAGGIDRLYVHSPDRLARRYAYQHCCSMSSTRLESRWSFSIAPWASRPR